MTFEGYLSEHWGLLILLLGFAVILFSDTHLERRILNHMAFVNGLLLVYSITCYVECYLGDQQDYSPLRPLLSAVNYSVIVFILVNIILVIYPKHRLIFWIPAYINCILCFISLKTGIVFYISKSNHFGRGKLGYLTYCICTLYLIYFIYKTFQNAKNRLEDYTLPIFMSITSVMCLIMPLIFEDMAMHWFNVTIALEIMFYYVYILQQFTKRDPLTKLLNRQSYYSDAEKYINNITGFVAIDMNGLKEINDKEGHVAGDKALQTLADCFWTASDRNHRVYRIGGDEYVILCNDASEEEVIELIKNIKQQLQKTPYSCSIGYAMKNEDSTLDSLYQQADERLYEEKRKYYESTGKDRRKRRGDDKKQ